MVEAAARPRGLDPRWLTVSVTAIGTFMSFLDQTIVNIALPSIMGSFGADLQSGQRVLTGYMIALAVVIPLSGFLSDRLGMKRLYLLTLTLFVAGSVLCSLAWSLDSLIAFRILQGLGGGMLMPLGMAIVLTVIAPRERGHFMAVLGLPMLLAPLLGPTLGGLLLQTVGWRPIFMLNVPTGAVALLLAVVLLHDMPPRPSRYFDGWGWALSALAFVTLLVGLGQGPVDGWHALNVRILLGVGIVALLAWIVVELTQDEPLLDLRLFRNYIFCLSTGINFVVQISLFGMQFMLPLFLQNVRGLSPLATGFIMFPQAIASFLSMNVSGRLYNRLGPRKLAVAGMCLLAVTNFEFSQITDDTPNATIMWLSTLRGFSMGLCMMPVQTAAYNTVSRHLMPRATAMSNVLMRLFGAFSTVLLSSILSLRSQFHYASVADSVRADSPGLLLHLKALHVNVVNLTHLPPEAVRILNAAVKKASMVMAFEDAFLLMSLVSVVGVVLALWIHDPLLRAERAAAAPPAAPESGRVTGPQPAAAGD